MSVCSFKVLQQILLKHPKTLTLISTHLLVTKTEFILVENILIGLKKMDWILNIQLHF